jgi:RimJ/RimL family protein N-acetyltransferase
MLKDASSPLTSRVLLRDVREGDLSIFFEQQLEPEATYMAAFTAKEPANRDGFMIHWRKILADERITIKTILFEGQVAGHILSHDWFGEPELSYWIGKAYWGKGIATTALATFLALVKVRPLYGGAAKDNLASIRVLQKCGFTISGYDKGFANARDEEIEEVILVLKNGD